MRNIALFLTYLGTDYHGWQVQKNLPTVAETLEKAAAMIVKHPVHMTGCGRTDAGVHAQKMIAHFDAECDVDCRHLVDKLNRLLPADIAVQAVRPVCSDAHARFSATARTYHYYIVPSPESRASANLLKKLYLHRIYRLIQIQK